MGTGTATANCCVFIAQNGAIPWDEVAGFLPDESRNEAEGELHLPSDLRPSAVRDWPVGTKAIQARSKWMAFKKYLHTKRAKNRKKIQDL